MGPDFYRTYSRNMRYGYWDTKQGTLTKGDTGIPDTRYHRREKEVVKKWSTRILKVEFSNVF
jgi:hypothetical protein